MSSFQVVLTTRVIVKVVIHCRLILIVLLSTRLRQFAKNINHFRIMAKFIVMRRIHRSIAKSASTHFNTQESSKS